MTEPGKFAPGLKGFPTPNTATGAFTYLLFYLDDPLWAQYILGACKPLGFEYNWYEAGDLLPDEASEAFRLILQQAPLNKLPSCSLPNGEPLMRVDPETGHIQSVDSDGNWQDEPSIPATPARPAGAPDDQRCDAAANTANALQILYENLTDSWSHGLTVAEAITAFVVAVGEAIAAAFFPPAAALIAALGLIFEAVYATIAFVGADVWTSDFTDVLLCYLYDCSTVDSDVVTYNFDCIIGKLVEQTDAAGLSDTQLRLFGQIYYILNFIGVDGLNYAGAATTITGADCSGCADTWCYDWHDGTGFDTWVVGPTGFGVYAGGVWEGQDNAGQQLADIIMTFTPTAIESVTAYYSTTGNDGNRPTIILYLSGTQVNRADATVSTGTPATHAAHIGLFGGTVADEIRVFMASDAGHTCQIDQVVARGDGANPIGADNCV